MTITYGFYNSIDHDRVYDAESFGTLFDGIITEGIFAAVGEQFKVEPGVGFGVVVRTGKAWFNNTWTENDSDLFLNVEQADLILNRTDAVVIEVNSNDSVRANTIKIVTGAPSSNPIRPTLERSENVNQYPIAYITVNRNQTAIDTSSIQSVVGVDTPFVATPVESIDVRDLYSGWDSQFRQWFNQLESILDENAATNLQNQINEINEKAFENTYSLANKTTTINKTADGVTTSIVESSDIFTATTTFEVVASGKKIITILTPTDGELDFTKIVDISKVGNNTVIKESYTSKAKGV